MEDRVLGRLAVGTESFRALSSARVKHGERSACGVARRPSARWRRRQQLVSFVHGLLYEHCVTAPAVLLRDGYRVASQPYLEHWFAPPVCVCVCLLLRWRSAEEPADRRGARSGLRGRRRAWWE